jgi:hypothetical protein
MRNYLKILLTGVFTLVFFFSCDSDNPTNPPNQNFLDYYPSDSGSTFKYSVKETDTLGNIVQQGSRSIGFTGTTTHNRREYITQADTLIFDTLSTYNTFLFRKSNTGVFYAIDTSQISQFIPDTLRQYVTLRDEMQLLFYPLTSGSTWSMYRITAEVQPGIEIKIVDIITEYDGAEQIDLNLTSGTVSVNSQRVRYTLEYYSDVNSEPETYTAYMWFVENIGIVKFEGNQIVLSLTGAGINIDISPNVLTQELIEYNIQ